MKFLAVAAATTLTIAASVLPAAAFTLDGQVNAINQYFSSSFVSGAFSNAYTFSLAEKSSVNASISGNPGSDLSFGDFGIFSGPLASGYTEQTSFTTSMSGKNLVGGTSSVILDIGTYFIGVTGSSASTKGTYNGTLAVSAVPLPSSVALFGMAVLGLGAVGVLRNRASAQPSA